MGRRYQNLINEVFGLLTVIEKVNNSRPIRWYCKCSCDSGIIKPYRAGDLKSGDIVSCGCIGRKLSSERLKTHGLSRTKQYNWWKNIKYRCYNENDIGYKNYGGRGIKVCDEWINNPEIFINYIKSLENYGVAGYSIDRINNDGNYEPGNIKFSTKSQQSQNTRKTLYNIDIVRQIRSMAESRSIIDIAKELNIPYSTIIKIVKKEIWKDNEI